MFDWHIAGVDDIDGHDVAAAKEDERNYENRRKLSETPATGKALLDSSDNRCVLEMERAIYIVCHICQFRTVNTCEYEYP